MLNWIRRLVTILMATPMRSIFFVLVVISGQVSTEEDLFGTLNKLISTLLSGVELTTLYVTSYGTKYPPIDEDVTFWCVQPKGKSLVQTYVDDPKITDKINFDYPIKFLIHGWLGGLDGYNRYIAIKLNENDGWMRNTSVIWAEMENCNVCSVDWSRLSNYEYSIAALVHTDIVAKYMIEFMNFLKSEGMKIRRVSIAGHSLGAQIAGKVGRYYRGLLDAIFGMDPAGPGFTIPWDYGVGTRLTEYDAQYVQCIQTATGTLGTHKDCGHANFIINGGIAQPGCLTPLCSHSKSHDYFDEALFPGHIISGAKCSGRVRNFFSDVLGMPCSMDSERLGIYALRKRGRFFVTTNKIHHMPS